jgi:hypothetical protein
LQEQRSQVIFIFCRLFNYLLVALLGSEMIVGGEDCGTLRLPRAS